MGKKRLTGLKMEIKDERKMRYEPHLKKPYYLYVEWGNRNFYFSNKHKAERWLVKYKKHVQDLYREMIFFFADLYKTCIYLIDIAGFTKIKQYREDFNFTFDMYHRYIYSAGEFEAGTEIHSLYNQIIRHLTYYREVCRRSNRHRVLYENLRHKTKQAKRLYREYELLVVGAEGINQITTDVTPTIKYLKKVTIPA